MLRLITLILLFATHAAAQGLSLQIRTIIDEYENSVRANTMKIIQAKSEAEKDQYRATIPSGAPCAAKLMALVKTNAENPEVVKGVTWLAINAASFPEGEEALSLLGKKYAGHAGIAETVKQLEYRGMLAEPMLTAVLEKNNHREEKAAALYALGAIHFKFFDTTTDPVAAAASKTKALDFFQRLSASYSDVIVQGFKLADAAGKMLFEISNLQPGCEAPELEGKDAAGEAFKLSDYRGKHIIVMFWGGWCHACHGMLPLMNQTALRFKEKPVVVLGVNTDVEPEAQKALATYQVSFRNWLDNTSSGPNTSLYAPRSFPTLYLFSPKGIILLKNASLDAITARIDADLSGS